MEVLRLPLSAGVVTAAFLNACAMRSSLTALPPPSLSDSPPSAAAAWVELGSGGSAVARAVVPPGAVCPLLHADGVARPMQVRAAASAPQDAAPGRPADFEMTVCEAPLPPGTRAADLGGTRLPVPATRVDRLVVIGDTGCRIKNSEQQDCAPAAWPFAALAADAARRRPDLVIHLGDYHYREGPCPSAAPSCQGIAVGYGWNVWQADFFAPAAPLLASAPWVMVRGNHEECRRAGQGWFRLLAPEPFQLARSCRDPQQDASGDYSPPYAVPLGAGLQLIVFDSARAGNVPLDATLTGDALTLRTFQSQLQQVAALAGQSAHSWFLSHHPVLAYAPDSRHPDRPPLPGNPALQQALRPIFGTRWFPPQVDLGLHGHVHLFQAIDFSSGQPATLVAGNGGDLLDRDWSAATAAGPAAGVTIAGLTHASRFGYLWMEREDDPGRRWKVQAWRTDGRLLTQCMLDGSRLRCDPSGALQ